MDGLIEGDGVSMTYDFGLYPHQIIGVPGLDKIIDKSCEAMIPVISKQAFAMLGVEMSKDKIIEFQVTLSVKRT